MGLGASAHAALAEDPCHGRDNPLEGGGERLDAHLAAASARLRAIRASFSWPYEPHHFTNDSNQRSLTKPANHGHSEKVLLSKMHMFNEQLRKERDDFKKQSDGWQQKYLDVMLIKQQKKS